MRDHPHIQAGRHWDYWQQSYRYGVHGLLKYPAMMVPQMQGDLLDTALCLDSTIEDVLDPFVGAGTTLVESLSRDLNFTGIDVNPLAVLACQAKSGPFYGQRYASKVDSLLARISADRSRAIDVSFPERQKWFTSSAAIGLSRVRRAILGEQSEWARRLMWLSFAETVRSVSNTRRSTYKLHLRPDKEIRELPSVVDFFDRSIRDSAQRVAWHAKELNNRGLLSGGRPRRRVHTFCGSLVGLAPRTPQADLIITSPPYGDNKSTIPYGQFSYLQLRWIPSQELPAPLESYRNAYSIDAGSLGGSLRGTNGYAERLGHVSPAAAAFFGELDALERRDLMGKTLAFLRDYAISLASASSLLRPKGLAILTLGDRMVGGIRMPLGEITAQLLRSCGLVEEGSFLRSIPQKQTPQRNALGSTMGEERVLIAKKL